jgi:hypothetical protein
MSSRFSKSVSSVTKRTISKEIKSQNPFIKKAV